jgi:hypothetical protein
MDAGVRGSAGLAKTRETLKEAVSALRRGLVRARSHQLLLFVPQHLHTATSDAIRGCVTQRWLAHLP